MRSSLAFLSALALLVVVGCTNRPVPALRPIVLQNSLEAVDHWNVLAAETAAEIAAAVGGGGARVSIEGNQETPFGRAFHDFLTTQLVRNGVDVAPDGDGMVKVAYEVQVVNYPGDRPFRAAPGVATGAVALAGAAYGATLASGAGAAIAGLATAAAGAYAVESTLATSGALDDNTEEVIIHTTVSRDARYLLRRSDIFYIRPAHVVHDLSPPEPAKLAQPVYPAARRYSVVAK